MDDKQVARWAELGLKPEDAEVYDFDPSEGLDSPEAIAVFMEEAFATGNAHVVADCLGVVAKAVGMTEIARRSGVSRQDLYDTLTGKIRPRLDILLTVLRALGVEVHLSVPQPARKKERVETA